MLLNTHGTLISTPASLLMEQACSNDLVRCPPARPRRVDACPIFKQRWPASRPQKERAPDCAAPRHGQRAPVGGPQERRAGAVWAGTYANHPAGLRGPAAEARAGLRPSDGRPCATQRAQATSLPLPCPRLCAPAARAERRQRALESGWRGLTGSQVPQRLNRVLGTGGRNSVLQMLLSKEFIRPKQDSKVL